MDDYIAERLTKSTAPRKDVGKIGRAASTAQTAEAILGSPSQQPEAASGVQGAGTQALPVDTAISASAYNEFVVEVQKMFKRGRPRIHPDRKAYKAEHERQRRAKLKDGK